MARTDFLAVLAVGYLLLNSVSAFAHLGQMVVYAIIFGVSSSVSPW